MKMKAIECTGAMQVGALLADVSGLPAEGVILTPDGERRLADLRRGDRVITRDTGIARVTARRDRTVVAGAVCIRAGSLGHTRPDRNTILPAGQAVLVRDWRAQALFGKAQALVPVRALIDGEFVTGLGPTRLYLCEITFDRGHVVYVDGLELAVAAAEDIARRA